MHSIANLGRRIYAGWN